jgi:hypothetical protein
VATFGSASGVGAAGWAQAARTMLPMTKRNSNVRRVSLENMGFSSKNFFILWMDRFGF